MVGVKEANFGNQKDAVDDKNSLIGRLFASSHELGDDFIKNAFKKSIANVKNVEFKVPEWPFVLSKRLAKILNSNTIEKAANEFSCHAALISSKLVDNHLLNILSNEKLEQIKSKKDFPSISGEPIHRALQNQGEAIVSRVLETSIKWLIEEIDNDLKIAKGSNTSSNAKLSLILCAPDKLAEIGKNESMSARKNNKKLDEKRGISYFGKITGIRHLALWSGSMRAIAQLKTKHPQNVDLYLREGEPSERGNIASVDGNVIGAFCVQLGKWDVGLDSNYYRIVDSNDQRTFLKEMLTNITNSKDLDDIESKIDIAAQQEQKLLNMKIYGERICDIISKIVDVEKKKGNQVYWEKNTKNEYGFIPWFQQNKNTSYDSIAKAQNWIDKEVLWKVRQYLHDDKIRHDD
jgi:hypothetical protein